MKRLAVFLSVIVIMLAVFPQIVLAGPGPHGGGYTATTDACAGCHRAHTATQGNLLTSSTEALCLTCHGSTAAGAQTNVTDGVYGQYRNSSGVYVNKDATEAEGTVGAPLLGGGFEYYQLQGQSGFSAVTSYHDVSGTEVSVWGLGSANTGQTAAMASGLTCGTCHDPHGSTNYRILRLTVNGHTLPAVDSGEDGTWNYTAENWGSGMSAFCAACHENYGEGGPINTGGVVHFRHDIDMNFSTGENVNPETVGFEGYYLPLAHTGQGDIVVCTTCHLPHGSSAAQGENSAAANVTGDSSLLRLDNRGVCEVCHQK